MKTYTITAPYDLIPKRIEVHCQDNPDCFVPITFDEYDLATGYLISEDTPFAHISASAQEAVLDKLHMLDTQRRVADMTASLSQPNNGLRSEFSQHLFEMCRDMTAVAAISYGIKK